MLNNVVKVPANVRAIACAVFNLVGRDDATRLVENLRGVIQQKLRLTHRALRNGHVTPSCAG